MSRACSINAHSPGGKLKQSSFSELWGQGSPLTPASAGLPLLLRWEEILQDKTWVKVAVQRHRPPQCDQDVITECSPPLISAIIPAGFLYNNMNHSCKTRISSEEEQLKEAQSQEERQNKQKN